MRRLQTIDKKLFSPEGGRIALSANERIAEFLDFAIQARFAYVSKLNPSKSSWRDLCVCFLNYAMPLSKRLMALKMPLTEAKLMLCSVPTPKMRRPPGTRSSM